MGKMGGELLATVILLGFIIHASTQAPPGGGGGGNNNPDPLDIVFFQGFNWESWKSGSWYNVLEGAAKEIAGAGITDVWFPPPSQSVGPQGYLPGKLYDLDESKYGTSSELRQAVQAFHQNGVGCVCDIVINHRTGSKQDDKGNWCIFEGGTDDDRLDWGAWAIPVNDKPYSCGTGNADTGKDYEAAPDVDHTNPRVQSELSEWMKWLMSDIGFDGWRFDFARGYAGNFLSMYIQNTTPSFAVGEVWDTLNFGNGGENAHRQGLVDWVHSTADSSAAFDFTTKGILQLAVQNNELWRLRDSNGKPSGMIGVLPEKAITFIDNHDTGSTQNLWPFPPDKLMQGYAYILTHPGVPTIFYDHFQDTNLKGGIKQLIEIRKRNQIKANSACTIITAESDLYMANIEDKVIMKIGARYDVGKYLPSKDFQLTASGNDYVVWERKT
ncbi:alpha-amylase [Cryptomeria japonica]|uniref:alpha-amylase n=1 Tax=Cryptomeria japonica TaxID=3369 RepID=UPI0027DA88C4|nr:alpha-amylase [Cryptomeria japonica]